MKNSCLAVMWIMFFSSCSNNDHSTPGQDATTVAKTDSFFPVTSFLKGQILLLDSLPVTPLQITTTRAGADSVWLTKEQLKPLLQPFLQPAIRETNFTAYFLETRFNDQTLNAITFTYAPVKKLPDSIELRHWDVYIDPETGFVKRVYIVKEIKENNQLITQQLTWQTNKLAKISTIRNKPDGNMELLKEVVFKWDFDVAL